MVSAPSNVMLNACMCDSFLGTKAGDQRGVHGVKLCWCPPGRFTMGSPRNEPERRSDEDQVEVTLTKGFWMGKFEATQGDWKRAMGRLPGPAHGGVAGGRRLSGRQRGIILACRAASIPTSTRICPRRCLTGQATSRVCAGVEPGLRTAGHSWTETSLGALSRSEQDSYRRGLGGAPIASCD